ncbi:MAG: SAM-dependent chlorinase/fluorinase [Magnetospirillum sp.]|nr:SAM-dependent chlorinase/fluorinase [Magnetospirillum sp.]
MAGHGVRRSELAQARGVPVIDLMADAPVFNPHASAYLLAALVPEMPEDAVIIAVVDPGVGGERQPMVAEADGRLMVGPDNGLLEIVLRRAKQVQSWHITWRPDRLSATFHGRDLFAPIAAKLAQGISPEAAGCLAMDNPIRADWPDDLCEIIYVDHYGNGMTGLRANTVAPDAVFTVNGQVVRRARTYSEVPAGTVFWYENSIGLVEISVSHGRAESVLGLSIGTVIGQGA